MSVIIITLLFLATMLCRNAYCHMDNNYKLIALASVIVIISTFTPSGLSAAICLGFVVSTGLIVVDQYETEDLLVSQFAVKLFRKKRPTELDEEFGTYGGGFGELAMKVGLMQPMLKRIVVIQNCVLTFVAILTIITIVILGARIVSSFGWFSLIVIPTSVFFCVLLMIIVHNHLYER